MGYYITVDDGVNYYVEDLNPCGNKVILFLHGWPGNHKLFEYQFDQLPKLGFRCIGIDTRGFGNSDKPFCGYDYDTLADDVKSIIEQMNLSNITLLGHSTGGAIACRYMRRHKGYGVSRLVLCAAAAPSLIKRPNFPYGLDQETVDKMIQNTYKDRPQMLQDFGNIFFFQHITAPFSDWFLQLGLEAAGWATAAVSNTWIQEVLFSDLESINVPTLIIHGIHDQVVPFELGEIQNKMIRNSVLVPFEFSGHGSFYDQQKLFNDVVVNFIEDRTLKSFK
jgi:non-heme chloroperoxidase